MDKEEIHYWANHVNAGTLINAIRSDLKRAQKFFGKTAALAENEADLNAAVEAYDILNSSDEEIIKKMNRVPNAMLERLNEFPPDQRQFIEEYPRFTVTDIPALKKLAEGQLKRVIYYPRSAQ